MLASIRNSVKSRQVGFLLTGITGGVVLDEIYRSNSLFSNNNNSKYSKTNSQVSNQNLYLDLKSFDKKVYTAEEMGGNRRKDAIRYEYYLPNTNEEIGYIEFNSKSGQVGFFAIKPEYQHKRLGTQMLEEVKAEMKKNGLTKIYGYSDAEEFDRMAEHGKCIKIDRGKTNFDYVEAEI